MEGKTYSIISEQSSMFILCDLWGTLLLDKNSIQIINEQRAEALQKVFLSKGFAYSNRKCNYLLINERNNFKRKEQLGIVLTSYQRLKTLTNGVLSEEEINELKTTFSNIALETLPSLNSDLLSALKNAKANNNVVAILSNTGLIDSKTTYLILAKLKINQLFDYVFLSEEVGLCKPDEQFFEYAVKQMNAPKEKVLYIGDSYYYDYYPAMRLGYKTMLVKKQITNNS